MARVTAQLFNRDALTVKVTIVATVRELEDYSTTNVPSHSVAHRLHEVINLALSNLAAIIEKEVARE